MKKNEFKCSVCHGIFEKNWSDEEALAELNANWPGYSIDACDIYCDDCHKKLHAWLDNA